VRVIPQPFFDRPLWTDPLWWFGIVGGLLGGIIHGLRADLALGEFIYQLFAGTFAFTWWTAGLLLSTVRYHYRRRQDSRREHQDPGDGPPNGPEQPSMTVDP
jgi:predicted lipid-binding transport protein (Tim44 family)